MRKEKKSKEVKFNPADYDYMDVMPLEGWIWEFIRRSREYQLQYSEVQAHSLDIDITTRNRSNEHKNKFNNLLNLIVKVAENYDIYFMPYRKYVSERRHFLKVEIWKNLGDYVQVMALPNPDICYKDFNNKPIITGVTPVKVYRFEENKLNKYGNHCKEIMERILPSRTGDSGIRDTLYLGISTRAKIKDVQGMLSVILKQHMKPSRRKVRTDKWKYYLIVYDLKEKYKDMLFNKIGDILQSAYPYISANKIIVGKRKKVKIKSSNYFSEKNCENFYKSALSLINGTYKKYI